MAAVTNEKKNLNSQTEDVSEFIMLLKQMSDSDRIRKARRKDRDRSVQEMLLMMFRSAARDRRKDNGILQMV